MTVTEGEVTCSDCETNKQQRTPKWRTFWTTDVLPVPLQLHNFSTNQNAKPQTPQILKDTGWAYGPTTHLSKSRRPHSTQHTHTHTHTRKEEMIDINNDDYG